MPLHPSWPVYRGCLSFSDGNHPVRDYVNDKIMMHNSMNYCTSGLSGEAFLRGNPSHKIRNSLYWVENFLIGNYDACHAYGSYS